MFKLLKDTKDIGALPPSVAIQLFDSLVLPILEYGSEIWMCNKEITELESVVLFYLKLILGVKGNTSNLAVRGEFGKYPLLLRQKIKALNYWNKIIHLPNTSLVKKVYICLCDLNSSGYKTWASTIEDILNEAKLGLLWNKQLCNSLIIKCISNQLYRDYKRNWLCEINDVTKNPKLRTYCIFKQTFNFEPYLIKDFKIRKMLSRFRLSNHVLEIEKGRHCKPKLPIQERTCKLCNNNTVEDEQHFICVCPAYQILRQEYIDKCNSLGFYGIQNDFTISKVFNLEEMSFYLGKLISNMFEKRNSLLSQIR